MAVTLRRAQPADQSFLLSVYASTRLDEMALVPWSVEQKSAFVQMQFRAQAQSYLNQYPGAQYYIIEQGGQPIGRMIVDRSAQAILLMDITLLPVYRGRGLGTALICQLLDEADGSGREVRLHVEDFNRAMRLYLRLGFVKTGQAGIYSEMTRTPKGTRND
jgi:GNAT superfamily N-acetyltransferase